MSVTFHDMFCGAGGSTLGAVQAGAKPVVGMNHWPIACQSYETNHSPHGAVAACVDVVTQDPRRYPKADMLLASPECTHHSYARGKQKDDPSLFDPQGDMGAERSRATMWDVIRFAEAHRYKAVIVENVEAAVKWGLPRGKKLKQGEYGPLFLAWLQAMEALDYRWQLVHLNSMVCGVPQSRDRLYVVFWQKRITAPDLNIPALGWCPSCERLVDAIQTWKTPGATTGTYQSSYYYGCPRCGTQCALAVRPAAAAIDWTLTAPKIIDRPRPLKDATLARIRRGLERLRERPVVAQLQNGMVVQVGENLFERPGYTRAWPVDQEMPTVTGTSDRALVIPTTHHGDSQRAKLPGLEPVPTVTGANRAELAVVIAHRGGEAGADRKAQDPQAEPVKTIAASGNHIAVIVAERGRHDRPGGGSLPRDPEAEAIDTVAASGNHHALVVANYGAPDGPVNKAGWSRHVDDGTLGTLTGKDSHALFTYRDDTARDLTEPAKTITTIEQHALLGEITDEDVEQCTFRMLQPHELKLASGFTPEYLLHGNKTDQVMQVGNAVTAPAEEELVRRVMQVIA